MYQVNDMVCYASKGIFQVQEVIDKKGKNRKIEKWYKLHADHDGLETTIQTPADNAFIRSLASAHDIHALFNNMPTLENIWTDDKTIREDRFKKLLQSGDLEGWAQMAKSIYLTREERIEVKKDISEKDKQYLAMAEDLLFSEIAYALHIPKEQVIDLIKQNVEK